MAKEKKQSMFVVAYQGKNTADQVYDTLRGLGKEKKVKIKTAAVVTRKDNGKLKVNQKRRLSSGQAALASGAFGLLIIGTGGAALGFGAVGALLGSKVSKENKRLKEFLNDKLGKDDSVLAILVGDADWEAVQAATEPVYGRGEVLAMELTPEDEAELNALADNEDVAAAVAEEAEVVDDPEVEVVEVEEEEA